MKARIIVALLLSVFSTVALAQRGGYIYGAGMNTCGEYLEHRKQSLYTDYYSSWVHGYLSSYNMFASHPQVDIPKRETIHAYLEKHCRDKPLDHLVTATTALLADLGGWHPPKENDPK